MKKQRIQKFFSSALLFFFLFFVCFHAWGEEETIKFVYPIQEMSKPHCRFFQFSTLSQDCKMMLPILRPSEYESYKNDWKLYRRVYTVLWGSTYIYGWDVWSGGHSWVDIATSQWTPVYAITSWNVVYSWWLAWRGNTVKIKHTFRGKVFYSIYAHLHSLSVKTGDTVVMWQKIGEVGSTGNSTGNHLHFQIDMVSHSKSPWYRRKCKIKKHNDIVNSSSCFDELKENTVDPLLFLVMGQALLLDASLSKKEIHTVKQEGLLSSKEIEKKDIEDFVSRYEFSFSFSHFWRMLPLKEKGTLTLFVRNRINKRPFHGKLPWALSLQYDRGRISVFPQSVLFLEEGKREIDITFLLEGRGKVDFFLGEVPLGSISLWGYDPKQSYKPEKVVVVFPQTATMWERTKGVLWFQNRYGMSLINIPFTGSYRIASEMWVRLCWKKERNMQYSYDIFCDEKHFVSSMDIRFEHTFSWIFVFEAIGYIPGKNSFAVYSWSHTLMKNVDFLGVIPKDLPVSHVYYEEIMKLFEKRIPVWGKYGYLLPDEALNEQDALFMVLYFLEWLKSRCIHQACIQTFDEKISLAKRYPVDRFTFLKRREFISMLAVWIPLPVFEGTWRVFRDVVEEKEKENILRIMRNHTWKDYFWETGYFQPEKTITRAEGMYLLKLMEDIADAIIATVSS